jgi:hypothetical protein
MLSLLPQIEAANTYVIVQAVGFEQLYFLGW